MLKLFIINIFLFTLMLGAMPAYAAEALVITSETLLADRAAGTAVFEGTVVARQDDMVLSAKKMFAGYAKKGGGLASLRAEGDVKLTRGLQVLTAQVAIYDVATGQITFTGDPRAIDEGNVLIGEIIVYFMETEIIKVQQSTIFIDSDGGDHE